MKLTAGTKAFAAVLVAGLMVAAYVTGRRHGGRSSLAPAAIAQFPDTALDDETAAEALRAYNQLADYFEARLQQQRAAAPSWTEIVSSEDPGDPSDWQVRARTHLLDIFEPWPGPRLEGVSEPTSWFSRDGVTVSRVRIPTHEGIDMLAALLVPDDAEPPLPAILALHGSRGNLRSMVEDVDYHHGFAMALARNGFLVLAPYRPTESNRVRQAIRARAYAGGQHLEAVQLWQLVRAIDYVAALDVVDPDHIGVYGISWGGTQAMQIGAIDTRLSLALVSGSFTDRYEFMRSRRFDSSAPEAGFAGMTNGVVPGMAFLLDDVNLAALVVPRFFGVEAGQRDGLHDSAQREFAKVTQLYRQAGLEERARFISFEGAHETSVASVLPFLQQWVRTVPER